MLFQLLDCQTGQIIAQAQTAAAYQAACGLLVDRAANVERYACLVVYL